jgi:hypothetical protein
MNIGVNVILCISNLVFLIYFVGNIKNTIYSFRAVKRMFTCSNCGSIQKEIKRGCKCNKCSRKISSRGELIHLKVIKFTDNILADSKITYNRDYYFRKAKLNLLLTVGVYIIDVLQISFTIMGLGGYI